jgi:transcriptional regulator with XRE-family HTH domain
MFRSSERLIAPASLHSTCGVCACPSSLAVSSVVQDKGRAWPMAQLLRRYRTVRGIKQAHLAQLVRVSQSTISKWESGAAVPSEDQRDQVMQLLAVQPSTVADTWLARLVETSRDRVHAICDLTHQLLVASPARYQEWCREPSEMFHRPLLDDAPDDIIEAERRLIQREHRMPFDEPLLITTAGQAGGRYRVIPGQVLWERLQLTDGTWVRLVTSVGADQIPTRAVRV